MGDFLFINLPFYMGVRRCRSAVPARGLAPLRRPLRAAGNRSPLMLYAAAASSADPGACHRGMHRQGKLARHRSRV